MTVSWLLALDSCERQHTQTKATLVSMQTAHRRSSMESNQLMQFSKKQVDAPCWSLRKRNTHAVSIIY